MMMMMKALKNFTLYTILCYFFTSNYSLAFSKNIEKTIYNNECYKYYSKPLFNINHRYKDIIINIKKYELKKNILNNGYKYSLNTSISNNSNNTSIEIADDGDNIMKKYESNNDDEEDLELLEELYYNDEKTVFLPDPYEKWNRRSYNIHKAVDNATLKAYAKAYRRLPNRVKQLVRNFFNNVSEPRNIINHLVQRDIKKFKISLGRFFINSTIGFLGIADVAKHKFNMQYSPNDFATTLVNLGVRPGPFIVLPILGPSSMREILGIMADLVSNPILYITGNIHIVLISDVLEFTNKREEYLDITNEIEKNALDPYEKWKSIYRQSIPY